MSNMVRNCLFVIGVVLGASAVVAMAAGGSTSPSLNQSFDFGDLRGGYSTYSYDGTSVGMSASTSLSSGVVTSVDCYVQPASWYNNDVSGKTYFQVNMYIGGTYNVLPTEMTWLSQGQTATHRGISISENSSIGSYTLPQEWDGSGLPPDPIMWSNAHVNISLSPFTVESAYGNFSEYSWTNPWSGEQEDTFSYNVNWTGYTTNATASSMFGLFQPTSLGAPDSMAIPEPATLSLLALGFVGFIRRRKQK